MSDTIDISKIRAGDKVQIANELWQIVRHDMYVRLELGFHGEHVWVPLKVINITAHQPAQPEPQPFEWLTEKEISSSVGLSVGPIRAAALNNKITRKFGSPSERVSKEGES